MSNRHGGLLDAYGASERGTCHPADTDLGGTNVIAAFGEQAAAGFDVYDKLLQAGATVPVILAYGVSSDLTSMHSFATFGEPALGLRG